MASTKRNNQDIYDEVAANWWSDDIWWVRTLKNLVPGRLRWFDRHIDWAGIDVLDLGCAGGFMAEALTETCRLLPAWSLKPEMRLTPRTSQVPWQA